MEHDLTISLVGHDRQCPVSFLRMPRQCPRQCPVSANAIASQLVKNGKHESKSREFTRLVLHELSDFWRAFPSHSVNLSDDFSPREFSAALQHLKFKKSLFVTSNCVLIQNNHSSAVGKLQFLSYHLFMQNTFTIAPAFSLSVRFIRFI